jgi:hypothetical protein
MKKYVIYILTLVFILGLTVCSTEDGETKYAGRLYNSNDGTCLIAGEALDFYIDGKFIATINSGENISHALTAGEHTFRVLLTSTQGVLEPGYRFEILDEGWWFKYGCEDGTFPQGIGFDETWVNPDYDGTGTPAKTVSTDNGDGTFTVKSYDNVSDTVPTDTFTLTLTDEWTDSEGNLFLKIEGWFPGAEYLYELVKIHSDGETLEATLSDVDYPTEIDPTGWYAIYYRQ